MEKAEFEEWYGEPSDVFIERVNMIMDALKIAVVAGVGFEVNADDAKRMHTYIMAIEQHIHGGE